jgi:hypothetical protein
MDDHDSTGDAVLEDNAPDTQTDHDDELAAGLTDLVEPDPPDDDTAVSGPGSDVAVETAAADAPQASTEPTVLERMRSAGINDAAALEHLQRGWLRLDGQVITDPDHPAPPPARWVILPQINGPSEPV